MHAVTTPDGRTLTVREGGDLGGVPVLTISGTPGSSTLFEAHVRDADERGIRLFSYDRPGYGGSTRHAGRTAADCAADIQVVCDDFGFERICVWGISGGGPHALAAAALLPERVAAAASLASVAPYDAGGLDWTAGMGEQNIVEFGAATAGRETLEPLLEDWRPGLASATPGNLAEELSSLVAPVDREALDGDVAAFLCEHIRTGLLPGSAGWVDDD